MLSVRYLFSRHNIKSVDRTFLTLLSRNSSTGNRRDNVIKKLNIENKYLFGTLLETKKQRRKKLNKEVLPDTIEDKEPSEKLEVVGEQPIDLKTPKRRTQKKKISQNTIPNNIPTTILANVNTIETNSNNVDEHVPALEINNESNKNIFTERKKSKNGKLGTENEASNQFVFKSVLPVNDDNYPLGNSEKHKCLDIDYSVQKVLNYTFNDGEIKQYLKFPSVSKIMEDTMSNKNKLILNRWRQNMINEMGEEGFEKHSEAVKSRGHEFHSAVRHQLLGRPVDALDDSIQPALSSLEWMLEHVTHPLAVESIVAHPGLGYKGIPDCVAMFKNIPVVIDWKLSDKPKKELKDTYDAPVQISAYIGALNHDPNYKWEISHGLVAVAYVSGDPCDVFLLAPSHCQIYWRHWLLRVDKFKARSHLHTVHDIDEKALKTC